MRLAFKSFELNIPFDDKDPSGVPIDAQSEPVYKTHVDKINKMKDWKDSPFHHESTAKVERIHAEAACHESGL